MKNKAKNNKVKNINEYKKDKRNKNKKRQGRKIKKVIFKFGLFLSCFLIIIANLCGYAIIGNLKYDIHYLKKELREEEIRLEELRAKVDTNTSIREIEKRAKEELNMDYPKKNQIRYIEVKQ